MDIPRKNGTRDRRLRLTLYAVLGPSVVVLITIGLARLKPAAPSVDRATVWIDTVKRGPMDLQVRGLGRLVPETVRWIPAPSDGQVMRRLLLPGTAVRPDTVLLVLGNRELQPPFRRTTTRPKSRRTWTKDWPRVAWAQN